MVQRNVWLFFLNVALLPVHCTRSSGWRYVILALCLLFIHMLSSLHWFVKFISCRVFDVELCCSTVCCFCGSCFSKTPCGRQLKLTSHIFGGVFVVWSQCKLTDSKNVTIQSVCCVFAYLLSVLSAVFCLQLYLMMNLLKYSSVVSSVW